MTINSASNTFYSVAGKDSTQGEPRLETKSVPVPEKKESKIADEAFRPKTAPTPSRPKSSRRRYKKASTNNGEGGTAKVNLLSSKIRATASSVKSGKLEPLTKLCKDLSSFTLEECIETLEVLGSYGSAKEDTCHWIKDFWPKNLTLIQQLFARVQALTPTASANKMSRVLSACGKLQEEPQNLFKAKTELLGEISKRSLSQLKNYTAKDLCSLADGCSQASYDDPKLLAAICDELVVKRNGKQKLASFDSQNFTDFFHAFATLGLTHKDLLPVLGAALQKKLSIINDDHLPRIIWSLAILLNLSEENSQPIDQGSFTLLNTLLKAVNGRTFLHADRINLSQISPAINFLKLFHKQHFHATDYPDLLKSVEKWEASAKETPPQSSLAHKKIQEWMRTNLKTLGKALAEQSVGGYFVDITINKGLGDKHAIEIQGPSHFLMSGKAPGNERLRKRIITALGWSVAEVSVEEWNRGKLITETARHTFFDAALKKKTALAPKPAENPLSLDLTVEISDIDLDDSVEFGQGPVSKENGKS